MSSQPDHGDRLEGGLVFSFPGLVPGCICILLMQWAAALLCPKKKKIIVYFGYVDRERKTTKFERI